MEAFSPVLSVQFTVNLDGKRRRVVELEGKLWQLGLITVL